MNELLNERARPQAHERVHKQSRGFHLHTVGALLFMTLLTTARACFAAEASHFAGGKVAFSCNPEI